jgi:hypothetical protein
VAEGSLFFGFFLLAKQKKETRLSGETNKIFITVRHAALWIATPSARNDDVRYN